MSDLGPPNGPLDAGRAPSAPAAGISERTFEMLRQTRPWVRFFAVLGFIVGGLTMVGGCIALAAGAAEGHGAALVIVGLYPAIGMIFYVYPSVLLNRYATRIETFLADGQGGQLDAALEAQKTFWKYVGILTVVSLCLYAVIALIAIVASAAV